MQLSLTRTLGMGSFRLLYSDRSQDCPRQLPKHHSVLTCSSASDGSLSRLTKSEILCLFILSHALAVLCYPGSLPIDLLTSSWGPLCT